MQTIDRRADTATPAAGARWPIVALVVMVVAVLGLGTWWLVDQYTGVDRQIEVLLDDYLQAWSNGDGEALLAVMAPGGRHVSDGTPAGGLGGEELAAFVESIDANFDFAMEPLGDPVILGGPGRYLVVQPAEGSLTGTGFNLYHILKTDDRLLISHHEWFD
jgi:hypothetical protein